MLPGLGLEGEAETPNSIERHYAERWRYLADLAALNLLFWDRQFAKRAADHGMRPGQYAVRVGWNVARMEMLIEGSHN